MPEDNALSVLENIRNANYPDLSQSLLRLCYELEKRYQYDRDRDVALQELQRLIESEVARQMKLETDK